MVFRSNNDRSRREGGARGSWDVRRGSADAAAHRASRRHAQASARYSNAAHSRKATAPSQSRVNRREIPHEVVHGARESTFGMGSGGVSGGTSGGAAGGTSGGVSGGTSGVSPHVENMSRRSGNAAGANISNRRHAKRANRGYVDQILPATVSGESAGAYSRRMNRRDFGQKIQRESSLKRLAFILAALVLIVGIGAAAAYFAFFASVDAKLSAGGDEELASSLVAVEQGQPFYTFLSADLNDTNGSNDIDAALLARYDESTGQVTLVAIPSNVRITSEDSQVSLSSVLANGKASSVVDAVSALTGVKISHYIHVDKTGFSQIVDELGGISVTVREVVDDPLAGSIYLSPGDQILDGASAAVYLAASNYRKGVETQLACQLDFARVFATRFFAREGGFALDGNLDALADHLVTDMTARDMQSYFDKLQGIDGEAIYTAQIEGSEKKTTVHGQSITLFYPSASDVSALMESVEEGADPGVLQQQEQEQGASVDKDSFEITVRNGSGITGGATSLAQVLSDAGFIVAETGNADSYVYTETLVVYLDPEYKDACEAVVQALGMGRVVNGVNGYTFNTQVLVVLGSDWKPTS